MKYSLYLILSCVSCLCFSQQKTIDSLHLVLDQQRDNTLERLKTLSDLAFHYHLIDPDKGLEMSDKTIVLAKRLDLKDRLAVGYKNKAQNYHALSQDSMAMLMYDKAIALQTELKSWNELGRTTFNKGLIYFGNSQYEEANSCNLKAYEIFEREKDSFLMGVVLNSIGINQMYRSLYPEALDTYLKAARIYEAIENIENIRYASILTNIGILYSRLDKYDLSLEYHNKSLELCKTMDYKIGEANASISIGNLYDTLEQHEKALSYYQEALGMMTEIKNLNGIASARSNIGITYNNLKRYDEAINELEHAKSLFEDLNNIHNLSIVHECIGQALLENPNRSKAQLYEAKSNFNKALSYAKKSQSIQRESSVLENISKANAFLNNYESAYGEYMKAIKLRDSFLSTEKKEEIAKLEAKYEYEKKEATLKANHDKEQAVKEAEISRQKIIKNVSILGGSGIICASLIGFMLYKRKQQAHAKAKEASFNLKVSDTELKALRAQMNPHFIFNSLNSILDYIAKNDTENATNYLTKFSKLMRETLEKSRENEITLNEDITILKTYMDIENKRSNYNFEYTIHIDKDLDPENTLIPPMILQPFVENSIIHGLRGIEKNGRITISFNVKDDMLVCTVEDNGIGRQKSSTLKTDSHKQSLGMSITKSRIDILNKKRNTNGTVDIIDQSKGTKIEVKLPLTLAY